MILWTFSHGLVCCLLCSPLFSPSKFFRLAALYPTCDDFVGGASLQLEGHHNDWALRSLVVGETWLLVALNLLTWGCMLVHKHCRLFWPKASRPSNLKSITHTHLSVGLQKKRACLYRISKSKTRTGKIKLDWPKKTNLTKTVKKTWSVSSFKVLCSVWVIALKIQVGRQRSGTVSWVRSQWLSWAFATQE